MQSVLNISLFRMLYPSFADVDIYPDASLENWYKVGKCYIKDNDCTLDDDCREHALMLMLAHLLSIQDTVNSGNQPRIITSASESKVNVSLAEPPSASNFSYWLNCTSYGSQVLAMLSVSFGGGGWVGDGLERPLLGGGF
jgi:hypothetical protein